jgi:hypothetical protein
MATLMDDIIVQDNLPSTSEIPNNREAEEATLGAVLLNPEVYETLAKFLQSGDFYIYRHRWIWDAFGCIRSNEKHIDYLTVCSELENTGKLEEIGGPAYLTALLNQVPSSLHAESYGRIVFEMAKRRQMLTEANALATRAYDFKTPLPELAAYTRPRYTLRSAEDALTPRPPLDWIVGKLISRGSVNIFYGEPGAKKTYSLLSMAVCVACGKPWLEFETTSCKVLIIDEESGENRLSIRIAHALRGELAEGDIPLQYISLAQFKLDDKNDQYLFHALVEETGAELVIIDALADIMTGDENSKQETQPVLNALRIVAEETNAAIIVIHHANKLGGYRGTSAIKASVDLLTLITSEDGKDYINFKSEKNRDGEAISWAAKAKWLEDAFYLSSVERQAKKQVLSKSQEYVIRYLTEHGPSPLPEIMAAADCCAPGTARNAVFSLVPMDVVKRTNPEASGNAPSIYALSQIVTLPPQSGEECHELV